LVSILLTELPTFPEALLNMIAEYTLTFFGKHVHQWGCKRPLPSLFSYPRGIAHYGRYLYVLDQTHRILVLDRKASLKQRYQNRFLEPETPPVMTAYLGGEGSDQGQFQNPTHLVVYKNKLFITDYLNHKIQIRKLPQGEYESSFRCQGSCCGIAIAENLIYVTVASLMSHEIIVYDMHGEMQRKWGKQGSQPGEFQWPWGVAVSDGIVYVADSNNHRVCLFYTDGRYITQWRGSSSSSSFGHGSGGNASNTSNAFNDPRGIVIDSHGSVWISDKNWIHQYQKDGTFVKKFGGEKILDGCEQFCFVEGLCFVADRGNNQIKIFR